MIFQRFKTLLLLLFIPFLLNACGGGGGDSPSALGVVFPLFAEPEPPAPAPPKKNPIYVHYGDSLTNSGSVQRIQNHMPETIHLDRSYGGTHVQAVLDGTPPYANEPFEKAITRDDADWVLMRFGGAEIVHGRDPHAVIADIQRIVTLAKKAEKRVVLIGAFNLGLNDVVTPTMRANYLEMDRLTRILALEEGIAFIDILGVPVPQSEMLDEIHPGPIAQERIAVEIVRQLIFLQ